MVGLRRAWGMVLAGALVVGLAIAACRVPQEPSGDTGMMILYFEHDTVFVTIPGSVVTGGPVTLTQEVTFATAFLNAEGFNDEGVIEPRFRLDVAALDTTLVRFVRGTAFTGNLVPLAPGSTQVHFSLYDAEIDGYLANGEVPFTVN
jgi:hypothetical protein